MLTHGTAPNKPHNSFLDIDTGSAEAEKDVQLEKSRKYLTKCVEEITWLLQPPSHPPPPMSFQSQSNQNSYTNQQNPQGFTLEDALEQRRRTEHFANVPTHSVPTHQPPPVPTAPEPDLYQTSHQPIPQPEPMTRESSGRSRFQQHHEITPSPLPDSEGHSQVFSSMTQEPLEKITHTFDSHGRPVTSREEQSLSLAVNQQGRDVGEGFIFEETPPSLEPPSEGLPPRRPDTDLFPSANSIPVRSPPRTAPGSHRRRSSGSTGMVRRRSQEHEPRDTPSSHGQKSDPQQFKVRFALRGHLDVVRSVIFTGGGSPAEPEICTAGDDGMIKRWIIPASYSNFSQHGMSSDLDIQSYFTHRGHEGVVTSLAACPVTASFSTGGRVVGDGWIFSGGQDSTVRVWERGRVDPKATLEGHTDAVWAVCVLPATSASVFVQDCTNYGGPDRVVLASGSADGTVKVWAVSAPPQLASPQTGSRRGIGGSRRHSVTSGSNYPSSPQPSIATSTPFHYTLVHSIERAGLPSPTCISPLSMTGETFAVSYNDASILIFDTRTGEEIIGMASAETYDGTPATGINAIVATNAGLEGSSGMESGRAMNEEDSPVHGATGSTADGGVEGVVISGHEDQFIRFFDANSGKSKTLNPAHYHHTSRSD
jgi:striatin 1/3/4